MKVFITYADKNFKSKKLFSLFMAKVFGGFDKFLDYSPEHIENDFFDENKEILNNPRGGGYWLWKPYFILKTLNEVNDGDYVFYSDAGACFIKSVDSIIAEMEKENQCVWGSELPLIEIQWTKREVFQELDIDTEKFHFSNQLQGGYQLVKKCEENIAFYTKLLEFAKSKLITDELNSENQFEEFIEHRHDQSIFSLFYKKSGYRVFKDPTQIGTYPWGYTATDETEFEYDKLYTLKNRRLYRVKQYDESYSNVLFSYRTQNPLRAFIVFCVKLILFKTGLYKGPVR